MDNRFGGSFLDDLKHLLLVTNIQRIKPELAFYPGAGKVLSLHIRRVIVIKVVNDGHFVIELQQALDDMRPDEACTAGDQNLHCCGTPRFIFSERAWLISSNTSLA